jgi:hypothetical protein
MKRIYIIFGLALLCFMPLGAQEEREMRWENVTALYFAATNGTDRENALQQYLLFDEATMDSKRKLLSQYETFVREFSTMSINANASGVNKEIDETIANVMKLIKEHPEMADELKAQLKEIERMRGEYNGHVNEEVKGYTYDPKELLEKLTNIASGKRTYTACRDIGRGLYAVQTGACYGPLEPDAFKRVKTPEQYEYTWGAIDYDGNTVIEPIYSEIRSYSEDKDFIKLVQKDKNGIIRIGARGYDGRVRIPFIYDDNGRWTDEGSNGTFPVLKGGKWGFVDFDNNVLLPFEFKTCKYVAWWFVSKDGKNIGVVSHLNDKLALVVPMKYASYWSGDGQYLEMERFDGMIDCYDKKTYKFVKTEPKPEGY